MFVAKQSVTLTLICKKRQAEPKFQIFVWVPNSWHFRIVCNLVMKTGGMYLYSWFANCKEKQLLSLLTAQCNLIYMFHEGSQRGKTNTKVYVLTQQISEYYHLLYLCPLRLCLLTLRYAETTG